MATKTERKIIIGVAPVGRTVQSPAINPLTPKQVADEARGILGISWISAETVL